MSEEGIITKAALIGSVFAITVLAGAISNLKEERNFLKDQLIACQSLKQEKSNYNKIEYIKVKGKYRIRQTKERDE